MKIQQARGFVFLDSWPLRLLLVLFVLQVPHGTPGPGSSRGDPSADIPQGRRGHCTQHLQHARSVCSQTCSQQAALKARSRCHDQTTGQQPVFIQERGPAHAF